MYYYDYYCEIFQEDRTHDSLITKHVLEGIMSRRAFFKMYLQKSYLMFNKKVTPNSKHEARLMIDLPKWWE